MRLLPIGFTAFLLNFPAGLFVYWITSNLVTLIQNYVIYNHGPGKKAADGRKNPDSGKPGATGTTKGRQAQSSDGQRASENSEEDAALRAAKIAKRKRRKKKK
jgi:YidC/Oxa1 family membrane protein insertase